MAEDAAPTRLELPLATRRVGRVAWHYESVASTMPLAHELAAAGAADGTILLAEEQTAGRGRRGRSWRAPRGSAILCSLICRPPLRPGDLFLLTAAVSVGLCAGIARATGLRPQVKWPNDLLLDGRKLAGVLCESRFAGAGLAHAVVGFGLNVNLRAADLPDTPGALPPTSLALALGRPVDRADLLPALLAEIDAAYGLLWDDRSDHLHRRWQALLAGLGEEIRIETDQGARRGRFAGVDRSGALLLQTGAGIEPILVGDVIVGPRPAPTN